VSAAAPGIQNFEILYGMFWCVSVSFALPTGNFWLAPGAWTATSAFPNPVMDRELSPFAALRLQPAFEMVPRAWYWSCAATGEQNSNDTRPPSDFGPWTLDHLSFASFFVFLL
jgi:hypothetical protein